MQLKQLLDHIEMALTLIIAHASISIMISERKPIETFISDQPKLHVSMSNIKTFSGDEIRYQDFNF